MPHPSPQQLTAFGLGNLSRDQMDEVAGHLQACADCVRKVRARTALPERSPVSPRPAEDLPAELAQSSKFEVLGKLGQGGMGAVYKVRRPFLGDVVALKVMNPEAMENSEVRDRFRREMKAAGQLHHKHIVRALDADQIGNLLLLVMEYVEGRSLDQLLGERGTLPIAFACHCIVQAALGLEHAHEKGLVHRDIKPANLMINPKGLVKILDFGLARLPREQIEKQKRTQMQVCMGTADYMAPEQATDARSADIRADIYSLGCTLYHLLAGRPPFAGPSYMATIVAHVQDEARPLTAVRPEVPAELSAVVARMMAKSPADRFQAPGEVVKALVRFCKVREKNTSGPPPLPGNEVSGPTPEPDGNDFADFQGSGSSQTTEKEPTGASWPRWPLAVGAALLLGLVAAGSFLMLRASRSPQKVARQEPTKQDSSETASVDSTDKGPERPTAPAPGEKDQSSIPQAPQMGGAYADASRERPKAGGVPVLELPGGNAAKPDDRPAVEPPGEKPPPKEALTRPVADLPAGLQKEIEKIQESYSQFCKRNDKRLLGAISREIALVRKQKLKPNEKTYLIQGLTAERDALEKEGGIPFSPRMRPATLQYLQEGLAAMLPVAQAYDRAIQQLTKAGDDQAASRYRAEKEKVLAPKAIGAWRCNGLNFPGDFTWVMLSNGAVGTADNRNRWGLGKDGLVFFIARYVDRCVLAADGLSFLATNQFNGRYRGTRVSPSR